MGSVNDICTFILLLSTSIVNVIKKLKVNAGQGT